MVVSLHQMCKIFASIVKTWSFCNTSEEKSCILAKPYHFKWKSFVKILWSKNCHVNCQEYFLLSSSEWNSVFVILLICVMFPCTTTYVKKLIKSHNSYIFKKFSIGYKARVQIILSIKIAMDYLVRYWFIIRPRVTLVGIPEEILI